MGDTGTGFYRIWLIKLDVFVLEHQNISEEDFRACKAYLGRLTKQEALLDSEPGVSASIARSHRLNCTHPTKTCDGYLGALDAFKSLSFNFPEGM